MSYDMEDAREEMREQEKQEYLEYVARRRRIRFLGIAAGLLIPAVVTIILVMVLPNNPRAIKFGAFPPFMIAVAGVAIAGSALIYLRPSASRVNSTTNTDTRNYIDFRMEEIFDNLKSRSTESEGMDRKQAIELLRKRLESEAIIGVIDRIKSEITSTLRRDGLDSRFQLTQKRLNQEVQDLARRGNLNLVLGILMAIAGLVTLTYAVVYSPVTASVIEIISHFLPRISLTILIELFAYFFLRLYKQTLQEIKYFQNELTNAESRATAAFIAFDSGDQGLVQRIAIGLAGTERNFVLHKGQTTVDLEREKIAVKADQHVVDALTAALRGFRGKGDGVDHS